MIDTHAAPGSVAFNNGRVSSVSLLNECLPELALSESGTQPTIHGRI